jgi:PAS domain S-box-containing protein
MNNLPEGFLENRLHELLADDEATDALRASAIPLTPSFGPGQSGNFDQPSAIRRPMSFDQPSAVRRPVSFDQPSAMRANQGRSSADQPLLNHPTLANFDQPSGRRPSNGSGQNPNQAAPNVQRPAPPPEPTRQAHPSFDQASRTASGRRANFDSPSRVQQRAPTPARPAQNNGTDWSSSLLNSISAYDEKAQPDTAELLQGALEALTDAVIITDCNGCLIWVNRYASELLDMPANSLMGTPAVAVFGKYAAAFVPAELLLLAPNGRLSDWQINLLLPSAVRRTMVFNFALTRRNGEQVVVAIGHEYREPAPAAPVPNAPATQRTPPPAMSERITVRLRNDNPVPPLATVFPLPQAESNPAKPAIEMPPSAAEPLPTPTVGTPAVAPVVTAPAPVVEVKITETISPADSTPVLAPAEQEFASVSVTEAVSEPAPLDEIPKLSASQEVRSNIVTTFAAVKGEEIIAAQAEPTEEPSNVYVTSPSPLEPEIITENELATHTSAAQAAEPVVAEPVATQPASFAVAQMASEAAETIAAQFWQFLEFAPEPMMVTDQRGRIVQLNHLAEMLFGYDRSEMLGEKALALLAKQSRDANQPRFPFGIADESRNGLADMVEVYGWHRDGTVFPLELMRRQTEDGHFVVVTLRPVSTHATASSGPLPEAVPTNPLNGAAVQAAAPEPTPALEAVATPSVLFNSNEHLRRHNRALGELSRSSVWREQGLAAALSEITALAAQALDTARVSIWLYDEHRTALICQDLFEAVDERHSDGLALAAEQFPNYFAALAADRTITAPDAHADARTAEFSEVYLKPNGISSMLDAPIRVMGHQIGVVCHEHIGAPREWSAEDESFAASVADFVAMAYEAEERLAAQASQLQLAAVLQATPDCVSITTAAGRLTFLNEAGRRLVERSPQADISDLFIADLYAPEANAQLESEVMPAALQNGIWTGETTLRRADGSAMPVAQVTFVQKDAQGQIEFIAHIHHDLSARKRMEEERAAMLLHEQQLRRTAEEYVQHKDAFLSTISHELRTPLTGIVGWIELIRSGTLDQEEMERALATIERDAQTQMKLVDDLLDASRVISDKLALDTRQVELMNVVSAALDTVRPLIEEKEIRLNVTFQPWVGPFFGDESRLQQVVWNLLSNAVKFTPSGGTISVALERNKTQAFITVRDSGCGIKAEFLPHLFERFRQQDGSTVRRHGGLGLGLAIAKHIVELHQGTITAKSEGPNQGTEFVVTLPLAELPSAAAPAKPENIEAKQPLVHKPVVQRKPLLAGVRVLAVDDQPGARDLFRTVLEQYQAEVKLAASAAEARQMLKEWPPDVLVSDIGMPNEDGCEMIRQIRALAPESGGKVPAIALTAYASEQDRLRALRSGFDTHLSKPVNPAELATSVAQLLNIEIAPEDLYRSGSLT